MHRVLALVAGGTIAMIGVTGQTAVAIAPATTPNSAILLAQSATTYRDPNGLFEISLPAGYVYRETGSGIEFFSADRRFGGGVDFSSAQGAQFTNEQLEDILKLGFGSRLTQVTWQDGRMQADGRLQVRWVGRYLEDFNLDAVGFIEQQGDTVISLVLFGVNSPYDEHTRDAEFIISSYRPRGTIVNR